MTEPLVSIITPTYNHERFIGECIESVLAQTYANWEMIIVDDGSRDGTWEIVRAYADKDGRIVPFRQENKGIWRLSETYNFALARGRGVLVAVLEGDDLWHARKLSVQVPFHVSGGYVLSFGRANIIDEFGDELTSSLPNVDSCPFLFQDGPPSISRHLLQSNFIGALTVLIEKQALLEVGGFLQPTYLPLVDYPTFLALAFSSGKIGFIDETLGAWRKSSMQTTRLLEREINWGAYKLAREYANKFPQALDGRPADELEGFLMTPARRQRISKADVREAAIALRRGDIKRSFFYLREAARISGYLVVGRYILMRGVRALRRSKTRGTAARCA